jgi:hypothetical protein
LPRLVDELKNGGARVADMRNKNLAASEEKAKSEEFFVLSKRLRGQAYQDAKNTRVVSLKKKRTSESPEPATPSKRKRFPSAKKDPQDTDSEDDTEMEDIEPQESEVKMAKGKKSNVKKLASKGKEPATGSKRKRANHQDTDSDDDTDLEESWLQEPNFKEAKSRKSNIKTCSGLHRADLWNQPDY